MILYTAGFFHPFDLEIQLIFRGVLLDGRGFSLAVDVGDRQRGDSGFKCHAAAVVVVAGQFFDECQGIGRRLDGNLAFLQSIFRFGHDFDVIPGDLQRSEIDTFFGLHG